MAALFELVLLNPSVAEIVILPQWSGGTYKQVLSGKDELSFTVSGSLFESSLIVARQTDVLVYRDKRPQGRLRVMRRPSALAGGKHQIKVTCVDYRQVLYGRILHHTLNYAAVDQAQIVWDLIDYTQDEARCGLPNGDLGLTPGVLSAGTPRDRTYEPGVQIGKLINDLTDNIGGFDWWIDHEMKVNVASPRRVRDMTGQVLQYGPTVSALQINPSDVFVNVARQTGDPTLIPETVDALPDVRGRWEENQADADLTVQTSVLGRAQRRLADGQNAPTVYVATIVKGEWGQGVQPLVPGDVTRLRAAMDHETVDATVRVHEVSRTLANEIVTLVLVDDVSTGARSRTRVSPGDQMADSLIELGKRTEVLERAVTA